MPENDDTVLMEMARAMEADDPRLARLLDAGPFGPLLMGRDWCFRGAAGGAFTTLVGAFLGLPAVVAVTAAVAIVLALGGLALTLAVRAAERPSLVALGLAAPRLPRARRLPSARRLPAPLPRPRPRPQRHDPFPG